MHRDPDADHHVSLGYIQTDEDRAEIERQYDLPRERFVKHDPEGFPLLFEIDVYTTREHDLARYEKDKKYKQAQAAEAALNDEEEEGHEPEPIEVYATPMPLKGALRVETPHGFREVPVPGGVRTIINRATELGWEIQRLTYARGPYLGANGKSLGVSDTVVLRVRGPVVDGHHVYGLGSWRDGKSDWAWAVQNKTISSVGARALVAWMKEHPNGQTP